MTNPDSSLSGQAPGQKRMNCCWARKETSREGAPAALEAPMRRGMPVNVKGSSPAHNSSPSPASLGGVGIVFQAGQPGGGLVVASLAVDGPADQSGQVLACDKSMSKRVFVPVCVCDMYVQVRAGDTLVAIDQIDVREMSAEELAQYILGPPGSEVRLGFMRQGNALPNYVKLTRGWTMKRSVESRWSDPLPPNHSLVPGALGSN